MQKYNSLRRAIFKRPLQIAASSLFATAAGWMLLSGLPIEGDALRMPWSASTASTQPEYAALNESDLRVYKLIFDLQTEGKWDAADALIATLDQDYLLADLLAQRYQHADYATSADELELWLLAYTDHAQAPQLLALAKRKDPARDWMALPKTQSAKAGASIFDRNDWKQALDAFEAGEMASAAEKFSALAESSKHPAARFWAYRSLDGLGRKAEAREMLLQAAQTTDSFYGLMALASLDRSNDVVPAALPSTAPLALHRTLALLSLGRMDDAQASWQAALAHNDAAGRSALLATASDAGLPVLQLARSTQMALHYANPNWQPAGGYKLQEALLLAIARKESLFKPTARSHRGALGVMQLMPATARYVGERFGRKAWLSNLEGNLRKPEISLALGQDYLTYLLNKPYINQNMIFLLAAYNAGPGPLLKWQKEFASDDPLLFMERIPYSETRHYVREVMKNYWVYRLLEGGSQHSMQAMADARWPIYWDGAPKLAQAAQDSGIAQN